MWLIVWFDWNCLCLGGTPWWNPVNIYIYIIYVIYIYYIYIYIYIYIIYIYIYISKLINANYGWNSRIENFKTICEIARTRAEAPKPNWHQRRLNIPHSLGWFASDHPDLADSSLETACCRFPRFYDGWMLFGCTARCRTATYRSSCACVCCTRSQNLGQQNSMASQLFPLKHSTKLYGVATLSFEALTPRKRTPQHRKNKYQNNQNISKYPYANDWLDLTWSTLIRHVWLHWYMASYSMGHPSTTAPHKRSTSNEAFKRLKVSLPFSKHARHWIPIPSDQTSPPGRMFINFPREF